MKDDEIPLRLVMPEDIKKVLSSFEERSWEVEAADIKDNRMTFTPTMIEIEVIKQVIEAMEQGYTLITIKRR